MKTSSPAAYPAGDLSLKASEENSNSVLGMVLWLKGVDEGHEDVRELGGVWGAGSRCPRRSRQRRRGRAWRTPRATSPRWSET